MDAVLSNREKPISAECVGATSGTITVVYVHRLLWLLEAFGIVLAKLALRDRALLVDSLPQHESTLRTGL